MGLDTTHGCWHGAYSSFDRWRRRIADAAGYGHQWPNGRFMIRNSEDPVAIGQGRWKTLPLDPVLILLLHSDCDGEIAADHALPLAVRLTGLLPALPEDDDARQRTEQFISGLLRAAAVGEPVRFH